MAHAQSDVTAILKSAPTTASTNSSTYQQPNGLAEVPSTPIKLAPLEDRFDDPRGGGGGSVLRDGADAFSLPFKNSTTQHHRDFIIGNALFKENWVTAPSSVKSRQGLGPLFNAQSCSTCHFKDGRGMPPESSSESLTGLLVRLSVPGKNEFGAPNPHPVYGDQLQQYANVGVQPEADVAIDYTLVKGVYADGSPFELRKPVIKITHLRYGELGANTMLSARVAPQVIGLGLLEAIPETQIIKRVDPNDLNHDGISGRPNYVWNFETHKRELGRFGWKSNQPTVRQQSAGAFSGDMGITSALFAATNCPEKAVDCIAAFKGPQPEINAADLEVVTTYSKLLAVPYRRNIGDADALKGRALFQAANCQACHASEFTTARVRGFPELSQQKIHPYTDLLLHDMGPGLSDERPDYEAEGVEWRTAPLWGVGLIKDVNQKTRLLHDGRARSIEEAILWHGGEAQASRDAFRGLNATQREQLVKFVGSL